MTPFVWGLLIGFVGGLTLLFGGFAYVWHRMTNIEHREPERIREDFLKIRDLIREGHTHDRRN